MNARYAIGTRITDFIKAALLTAVLLLQTASGALADYDLSLARGIKLLNIVDVRTDHASLKIKGATNPTISVPLVNIKAEDNYLLHIETKSSNPLGFLKLQWKADGKTRFYPVDNIPLDPSPGFHVYEIDMRSSPHWKGDITNLTIEWFGFNDDIEIKSMLLKGSTGPLGAIRTEINNLFMPFAMTPLTINLIEGTHVMGLSLITAANLSIIVCSTILLVFFFVLRRRNRETSKLTYAALLVLFAAWIVLDVREIISERRIQKASSVSKDVGNKSLYALGDFQSFAEIASKHTNKNTSYALLSNLPDTYPLHASYLLYPAKATADVSAANVILVYNQPLVTYRNGSLYTNDSIVNEGDIAERYNEYSFIFIPRGKTK